MDTLSQHSLAIPDGKAGLDQKNNKKNILDPKIRSKNKKRKLCLTVSILILATTFHRAGSFFFFFLGPKEIRHSFLTEPSEHYYNSFSKLLHVQRCILKQTKPKNKKHRPNNEDIVNIQPFSLAQHLLGVRTGYTLDVTI